MNEDLCPTVSVLMITYNHAPYIAEAIEGVLRQERDFPIELVIGEDCSTDGTRDIVLDYQKRYPAIIRVVTSDENVGNFANFERAGLACRGTYVAYCEGDDYWRHPRKLQKQVAFLEAHPDYGLVHSDVDQFDVETGQTVRCAHRAAGRSHDDEENLYVRLLEHKYRIWTCSVCARRSLVREVIEANPDEFQVRPFFCGDTPLWLELSRITRFKYMDESLAVYNLLPESASHTRDCAKLLRLNRSVRDMCTHYVEKYDCPAQTRTSVIKYWNKAVLVNACLAMDPDAAREALMELKRAGIRTGLKGYLWYLGAHNRIARRMLLKATPVWTVIRRTLPSFA